MITRITDNIKFNMITNSMFNIQSEYGKLSEKLSTQKAINRPSDDPIGTNDILDYRTAITSIEQYQSNITDANIWLNLSSTNLSGLRAIVGEAASIAISESGSSSSSETRQASEATLTSLIDEAISFINAKSGNNYLFSGSSTDVQPFSATYASASIGDAYAATTNTFNGTATAGGTYTGTENKNYALKIVSGGNLTTATCQVSSDGGATWGTTQGFPNQQVLTGSVANTTSGSAIAATTLWSDIDGATVAGGDTITISGVDRTGATVTGTYTITDPTTETVQGLLTQIQSTFGSGTATASIDSSTGRITLTDTTTGASDMEMTLTAVSTGLDFGTVSTATSITLGDGITMTFAAGNANFVANDTFTVNAYSAGYYRGNDDDLTTLIGNNNEMVYNITGAEAFTGQFASATVITGSTSIAADDSIVLMRGTGVDSWSIKSQTSYPDMVITSQSTNNLTIDADGDGIDDISLNLTGEWNKDETVNLLLTSGITSGEVPVTFNGSGSVDLLSTLNALKTALQETDQKRAEELISAQLGNLTNAETQILQYETKAGAVMNLLETISSNHDSLNLQITNMLSDIETADMTELIMEFQMKQIVMQASYSMASKIGKMTILDYL